MDLAAGNALAQGLTQGPFGLLVDIAYRGLLLDELLARRNVWRQREPELHDGRSREPVPTLPETGRPVALPPGPVEAYADRAARSRRGWAARPSPRLGRDLAHGGVLAMDGDAWRRLDRVDAVVLDADLLATGRAVLGAVWVAPAHRREAEQAWLAARNLLNPAEPAAVAERDGWVLAPAPAWPGPATFCRRFRRPER